LFLRQGVADVRCQFARVASVGEKTSKNKARSNADSGAANQKENTWLQ